MAIRFTDRELEVMAVLWDRPGSTVAEVRAQLGGDLAYTTVLSALQKLEAKGHVRHTGEGKVYRYHTRVPRQVARRSAIERLVAQLFGGSPEILLTELVSDGRLSAEQRRRLRRLIDDSLAEWGEESAP